MVVFVCSPLARHYRPRCGSTAAWCARSRGAPILEVQSMQDPLRGKTP